MRDLQGSGAGEGKALEAYECLLIELREAMLEVYERLSLLAGIVESLER